MDFPEETGTITGINPVEEYFTRFLSSPIRKWKGVTPFCVSLIEKSQIRDNIDSVNEDGETVPLFTVSPDVEDLQYETVQLFGQNKVVAKRHRLFLRAMAGHNVNNAESYLKDITDSFCEALQGSKLNVARECKINIVHDGTVPMMEHLTEEGREEQLENYPGLSDLSGLLPYPYHVYELERNEDNEIDFSTESFEVIGLNGEPVQQQVEVETLFGYMFRYKIPRPVSDPLYNTNTEEGQYIFFYRLMFYGRLNGVVEFYLFNYHSSNDGTYTIESAVDFSPTHYKEYIQTIDLNRVYRNISFEIINTIFTFIDIDDVGRELRDETLLHVREITDDLSLGYNQDELNEELKRRRPE